MVWHDSRFNKLRAVVNHSRLKSDLEYYEVQEHVKAKENCNERAGETVAASTLHRVVQAVPSARHKSKWSCRCKRFYALG